MRKREDKPAALDHVLYEIEMLAYSLQGLRTRGLPTHQNNAWLEAFAIHARNLNEFFGKKGSRGGYMRPDHFVAWTHFYVFDRDLKRRASNQIAHLTYDRERPEEKTHWPIDRCFKALRAASLVFLKAVAGVEPLMAYRDNKARTKVLLDGLPRIRFTGDAVRISDGTQAQQPA